MRVLLTGANRRLGVNTARALLHHGHEVVAFVRHGSDLRGLEGVDPLILDSLQSMCVMQRTSMPELWTFQPQANAALS